MEANPQKDIEQFNLIGDFLSNLGEEVKNAWLLSEKDLSERTQLYLEFLAGAFMKETGLKASETELVCAFGMDTVIWYFQKRAK